MLDLILKEAVPELVKVAAKKTVEYAAEHPVETFAMFFGGYAGGYALYQKGRADTLEQIINMARNAQNFR